MEEIYLDEQSIIRAKFDGDLDGPRTKMMLDEVIKLCRQVRAEGKKAKVLAMMTENGGVSAEARAIMSDVIGSHEYDKAAVYGESAFFQHMTNFIIAAVGAADRIGVFSKEEDALSWINA